MELSRLLFARSDRYDMLLHHLVCLMLVLLVVREWEALPSADLTIWHVIWASISRMLASNVFLNLRHLYSSRAITGAFAFFFIVGRVIQQIPVALAVLENGDTLHWERTSTSLVLAGWLLLQVLNIYWAILIVRTTVRKLIRRKSAKTE
mmetsp:Transcript_6908/g.25457  ORF Transcript_6908/g.25457 Transcript_6908/m.25457 type:complete len:149 (+) Transcript_6908:3-449(+)